MAAEREDAGRFIVHADEKLSAFVELERQVLTMTFYLESSPFRFMPMTNDASKGRTDLCY